MLSEIRTQMNLEFICGSLESTLYKTLEKIKQKFRSFQINFC